MEVIKTIFYFAITIGVLVLVHEFGHFIAAKLSKMRVEVFSIGFGTRLIGKKIGETDYRISAFPLGGYVKIAGMVDESLDTGFLGSKPEPYEFRSRPFYQKFFVITAGVIMNMLLAVFLFWAVFMVQGKTFRDVNEVGYIVPNSPAFEAGFKEGDKVLTLNGKRINYWDDIIRIAFVDDLNKDLLFEVQRDGEKKFILIPREKIPEFSSEEILGILPKHIETMVMAVEPGRPAEKIGIQPKDVIISANDERIYSPSQLTSIIRSNAGKEITLKIKRNDKIFEQKVTPDPDGRIGVQITGVYNGPVKKESYNPIEALWIGVRETYRVSALTISGIKQLITGKIPIQKGIAGPIRIAKFATQSADIGFTAFLGFMAILSISLAFLNIFPFPGLDGGHLAILIIEGIIRKELSYKVKIAIQQVGIVILIILMIFVLYNDIVHF
ncbi:site-2 protease. Metallo peptidase. MEROPS family M50B [Candidatus Kryptobacter tengchongensis]|uniref:RIP metalloprotease RseP n=1 Tax=Kryptobacter tengchongensis TaxID=1643429 RepID=UPI000708552E|nr:RIP metalloprotease RseP [Candidatus Kryptobacter tengchongensis]CUS80541.1 site-2 protease. Metallo peptidase. MEROPS family M50B [Candidatus Kryptobacter tengchongensis]CUU05758.1 site-2 protease. Metallo peptidase. MEROPS family M50B [Candidatus Kryptobacter tengchongensis]